MRTAVLVALFAAACGSARADDDVAVKELKSLSAERCLQLPAADLATRCPLIAGRFLDLDAKHVALLDRLDQRRGSFWCDQEGANWRCRRIVVIDRELRGARKRNPQAFVTTTELLRTLATSPSVKIGEEFGALNPPGDRPRTCLEIPAHGCATQAVRLRAHAADRAGTPSVRRRLWLVEDADGATLQCSDATFTRCDELTAAGWLAIAVMLRPSSLASPHPAPEFDLPEIRSDKRPGLPLAVGGSETADTPAGALDPWIAPKHALPAKPSKADSARATRALQLASRPCLTTDPHATIDLVLSGEGRVLALAAALTGVAAPPPLTACLTAAARKVDFPRFTGDAFRLRVVVSRK